MDIDRLLADHDGVVSAVYFAIAWSWTPAARVRVAAEWVRPAGVLASLTAAWWLGLGVDSPHPLTVILPRGCSRRPPPGVTVWQRDLPAADRTSHRGLPVVSTELAVLDAAVALGREGPAFLDRALQEHVDLDDLRHVQSRHLGRRGSTAAGRLIARAGDRAASEPERRLVALLRRAGITGWTVNLRVVLGDGRRPVLDVAFPAVRFAVEVDGWAHHVDHDAFVDDRARKRALVADGWSVIEVTWHDLEQRGDEVIAQLRQVLARLGADSPA